MEKERRIKTLSVVTLIVAVLGLTIAFAALSQTLTINGSAKLDASKWGLKFDNLLLASGNEYVEGTASIKTEDNTVIENMNVKLTTPGDKVVYTVNLVNEGSINAKIDKIEKTALTAEQSKYLSFKVIKEDNKELEEGYVLGKESSIPLRIEIEFDKEKITKEDLPTKASEIKLSYGLTFVQTDEEVTSVGQGSSSACTIFEKKDTYNVGDEIALCNNDTGKSEDFYVISDNGDTVTALAKYNLLVGNTGVFDTDTGNVEIIPIPTTEEGYGLQDSNANYFEIDTETGMPLTNVIKGAIAFAETDANGYAYWCENGKLLPEYEAIGRYVLDEKSLLYEPLKNYENYLKITLGKTSVNTSLFTTDQAVALGCTSEGVSVGVGCGAAPSWVYSRSYWMDNVGNCWSAPSMDNFNSRYGSAAIKNSGSGLRPVITISKTDL